MSNTYFSEQDQNSLEKRIKHNIQPPNKINNLEQLGIDPEIAVNNLNFNCYVKHQLACVIGRNFFEIGNTLLDYNTIRTIKRKVVCYLLKQTKVIP